MYPFEGRLPLGLRDGLSTLESTWPGGLIQRSSSSTLSQRLFWLSSLILLLLAIVSATPSQPDHPKISNSANETAVASALPAGFFVENAASGAVFNLPTGMTFAPDGRIFVTEKRGRVYIIKNGRKLSTPFINLEQEVLDNGDRGLVGVALHPNFANNGYVYLYYSVDHDGTGDRPRSDAFARLVRYTTSASNSDVADLSSRKVLIGETFSQGIPACSGGHMGGSIRFGTDGTMLLSTGDAASAGPVDSGGLQPGCFGAGKFDTIEDIGAFRAQYKQSLAGKILRIDPETGFGIPSNPFYSASTPHDNKSRVWALGLRSAFRFNIRQNGSTNPADGRPGALYIGDVGYRTWEDLNTSGSAGTNFGWPCYEGPFKHGGYQNATPAHSGCSTVGTISPPKLYWHHADPTKSKPAGRAGEAIIGGTFYTGTKYPSAYRGNYFYADYVRGWVVVASVDASNNLTEQEVFSDSLGAIVGIEYDPVSQLLHYIDITPGKVMRIRFGSGEQNEPPVARASATPTTGPIPLAVQFTGSASSDPDGDALTYQWDFGDGGTSSEADPAHTYTTAGVFAVTLTVTDPSNASASFELEITAGNDPPDGTILSPADGAVVATGDVVTLDATATDPDEPETSLQYRWEVTLVHNTHTHPDYFLSSNKTDAFTVAEHGTEGDSYSFRIKLLVTDSGGLTDATTHRITVRDDDVPVPTGLAPVGRCVWANGDGTYTALFGYTNGTGGSRKIGVGSSNAFSPNPVNRGQPTTFVQGDVQAAVAVVFGGNPLTWKLTFGGVTQQATLSGGSPSCSSNPIQPLIPIMHGITANGDGTYNAHFGYTNPNAFKVYAPVGAQNTFAPGTANRNQPKVFVKGTKSGVLVVTWNGSPLTWRLTGSAADASSSSPVLPTITPTFACVKQNVDGTYTARLGYENPSAFTVYLKKGAPANQFVPDPKSRTQPDKFVAGTKPDRFGVTWDGSPLTWELNGLSVTASSSSGACTAAALASMTAAEAQDALALADSLDAEGDTLAVWEDPELEGASEATFPTEGGALPEALALAAYPNPFSRSATVEFGLPEGGEVRLEAYDVLGRLVAVLAEGPHVAGVHRVAFEAGELPSGTYFLRLATPRGTLTSRITLVR